MKEALSSLPSDVAGVYHRIWSRIKPKDKKRAEVWFSWILLAFQSLSIEQFAAAMLVRNARTNTYDEELYHCLIQTLQEDLQRLFGPLIRFVMLESDGEVHIELSHQTVKEYFLKSADSEISSTFTQISTHTEMAKACMSWVPGLVCTFDQMFNAVQMNFDGPVRDWTDNEIEKAAALVAEKICSRDNSLLSGLSGLPRILRDSSFNSYAAQNVRLHLIAALVAIVSEVAPPLKARASAVENEFLRVIFSQRHGEILHTKNEKNEHVDLLAVCDMLCKTNAIKSSVVDRLGLRSKLLVEAKKAEEDKAMKGVNPIMETQLLHLEFTIPPRPKVFKEPFRVVENLPVDALLGLEHFEFQDDDSEGGV